MDMSIKGFTTINVLMRVVREEGVLALWKGGWPSIFKVHYSVQTIASPDPSKCLPRPPREILTVPLRQTIPATAITFGVYEMCKTAVLLAHEEREAAEALLEAKLRSKK